MIIKVLIGSLCVLLVFLIFKTIQMIRWNLLLSNKQRDLGLQLKPKIFYTFRFALILTTVLLIVVVRLNATTIYVTLFNYPSNQKCAYGSDDLVRMLQYNENVAIVTIDSLKEVREFDVFEEKQMRFVDVYVYDFSTHEVIRGTGQSEHLLRYVAVKHPFFTVFDNTCDEGTKLEVGQTYLIIGNHRSPSEAIKYSDPRTKDGNYTYAAKAILLIDYQVNLPLDQQEDEIREIIKTYTDIINQD